MKTITIARLKLPADLSILFGCGLLFWLSWGALFPTLPLYIRDLGKTNQQVGIAAGAVAVGLLLSRTGLGRIADRSSRQILLFFGLGISAIAPLVYWLLPSFSVLVGLRFIQGIGVAAFSTAYVTLVMDLASAEHRGKALSYMGLTKTLGAGFGALGGSFLQQQAGYPVVFLFSVGAALLGWLCCQKLQEPPRAKPQIAKAIAQAGFWQPIRNRRIGILVLLAFLMGLTSSGVADFLPLFVEDAKIAFNPGLFYLVMAIAALNARIFAGEFSDRSGRGLCGTFGFILYLAAMLVLWTARDSIALILAAILDGISAGMVMPTLAATIGDRTHNNERGRAMSFWMGGFDLGMAIAAPVSGGLASIYGYRSLFAFATGISGLTLFLFLTHSGATFAQSWRYAWGRGRDRYAMKSGDRDMVSQT